MAVHSIRIATWNADGLVNRRLELINFLNIHNIDIMLISETHFTHRTFFNVPNYIVYNCNRPDDRAYGGSAIIIRRSICHHELPHFQTEKLQATVIQLNALPWSLVISAVYCSPRFSISPEEYTAFFNTLGTKFFAGGDWNAKNTIFGSRCTSPKGRNLWKVVNEKNYSHISTGEPTYWPTDSNRIPDLLDFFILGGISSNYITVEPNNDLSSDHSPVIATMSTTVIRRTKDPCLTSKNTDWDTFRTYIDQNIALSINLREPDDIDCAANYLTNLIQEAAWHSTPVTSMNYSSASINVPKHVRDLVIEKRRARGKWQRSRNINDRTIYNRLNRKLHATLQEMRNSTFEFYMKNLSKDDNTLWKATKSFKRPKNSNPPVKQLNGNWARSNEEKANTFAEHLERVFSPLQRTPTRSDDEIEHFISAPCLMSLPIKSVSPSEVTTEIKSLKKHKTPGFDLITALILQQLPKKGVVLLTTIYNSMLRLSYFPVIWKFAQIIMIPKPGKSPHQVSSYRPISLLPIMSKIFERLLLRRLKGIPEFEASIPQHQFGFRENHSTIQQSHRIVHQIIASIEERKICTAAFLDIAQAFDKVWHPGLLYKLKRVLPNQPYTLLKSYLCDRFFAVKCNGVTSSYQQIKAGVPQGSVLGPVLYLIYTADIPETPHTSIATFADDTALLAVANKPEEAASNLQAHLNLIDSWTDKWRIKANNTKSVQVTFTTKHLECPPVTLGGQAIPVKEEVRYLGIYLDKRLTWKAHIRAKREHLNLKLRGMYWLMGRKSKLTLENKLLLYKTVIKPIWTYGIQLWGCAKPSHIQSIQRFQSKLLRTIADAPWYVNNHTLHRDLGIPYVKDEIQRLSQKYHEKLPTSSNQLIADLNKEPTSTKRLKRTWPKELLAIQIDE